MLARNDAMNAAATAPAVAASPHGDSGYRADVDGLRAVAVVLVILFHLSPARFVNGYVGVDVFFVISGFVVTRVAIRRRDEPPVQAMLSFWMRRVIRIYPALLACCLVTLGIAIALIPPFPQVVFNSIVRTGLAAVLGLSNIYLHRSALDYFRADQTFNPFVHTWSLGAEEQFYLLFSVVFVALPLLLVRTNDGRDVMLRRLRIAIMTTLTVASLALCMITPSASAGSYYLLPYRFWELGLGCLVALAPLPATASLPLSRAGRTALELLGLGLILAAATFPMGETRFSLAAVLVATATTAALIALGGTARNAPSPLLGSRALVGIGLLSYSLYLWHWPVLMAFGLTLGLEGPLTLGAALLLVLAAAGMSYRLVEQPFRQGTFATMPLRLFTLALGVVLVAAIVLLVQAKPGSGYAGLPRDWSAEWLPPTNAAYALPDRIVQPLCDLSDGSAIPLAVPQRCRTMPAAGSPPTLLVVGDSIAFADWGMLTAAAAGGALDLAALSHNGCSLETPAELKSNSCRAYWKQLPALVRGTLRPGDTLLLATSWSLRPAAVDATARGHIDAVVSAAAAVGADVVLQAPLPRFETAAFNCIPEWFRRAFHGCDLSRARFEASRGPVMQFFHDLAGQHGSHVRIWDPLALICPGETCSAFHGTTPVYRDNRHLSYAASRALAEPFARFLRRANDKP